MSLSWGIGLFAGFCFLIWFIVSNARKSGEEHAELKGLQDALERAKDAKDVRSGPELPDDKLHFRD